MANKIVTVFGASGFVGRHVVRELAQQGWRVRAAVRRPNLAQYLRPLGAVGQIDLVQCNVRYRPSVAQALRGADAVVNLVGILAKQGAQTFNAVHAAGARHIAEMAAEAGIDNIVHISAIGANADSPSDYAQSKAEGEAAMREFVPSAVILRPSIIFGPQDGFFNRFAGMAAMIPPFAPLPAIGGGKTLFQPIYVDDIADCVVSALETPTFQGRTFELGGPDVRSFNELMELMLKIIGRKRWLAPIPYFAANAIASATKLPAMLPFFQAPITHDQVKLLKIDNIVGLSGEDNVGTIEDFGITPKTMEAILPTYLVRFRTKGQFSPEVRV